MSHVAPSGLTSVARRIESRLDSFLTDEERRWSAFDDQLAGPVGEIRRLVLSGGKRLRPAFCHWAYVGAGGDPDTPIIDDIGSALELLHAFALFHDDIMDGSLTRRGAAVTHELYAAEHRASGSVGESRRYGDGIAILVGDLTFVYSDQLLANVPPAAQVIWHELRVELNIGQLLDLMGSATRERRREKTEKICRYKSGKYTIERPLHLGAMIAAPEREDELLPLLSAYGLPLGDAFQMRDDVLGAFGETHVTGKPVGDDLREGKPTPLLARACERATPAQMQVLDRVGLEHLDDDAVRDVQDVIIATGALQDMEDTIERLTQQALLALEAIPFESAVRHHLTELAEYVSSRPS